MLYRANWNYQSGLMRLEAGQLIDLREDVAETVNRDSPGVLSIAPRAKPASDDAPAGHVADHRRDIAAPPATRQVTTAAKRGPGRPAKASD